MLTETLLSFDQWQNAVTLEGKELPSDVTKQAMLYEKYIQEFRNETKEETPVSS